MAPGKRQKVRKNDDPLVPFLKVTEVIRPRVSKPCSGAIGCKAPAHQPKVIR